MVSRTSTNLQKKIKEIFYIMFFLGDQNMQNNKLLGNRCLESAIWKQMTWKQMSFTFGNRCHWDLPVQSRQETLVLTPLIPSEISRENARAWVSMDFK